MHALRTWSRRQLLIGAFALSLLFMQGLGLAHAIFHAGLTSAPAAWLQADAQRGVQADDDGSSLDSRIFDAHHSCASFNALTLAFALALSGLAALLLARSGAPRQTLRPAGRVARPQRSFLSRAPPFSCV